MITWFLVIQMIAMIAEYAIAMLFFKDFLGQEKDSKIKIISCGLLFVVIIYLANNILPPMGLATILIASVLYIFFAFFMFDSNWKWKLFGSLVYFGLIGMFDIIAIGVMPLIANIDPPTVLESEVSFVAVVISRTLLILTTKAIGRLRNKQNQRLYLGHWVVLTAFPAISSVVLYFFFTLNWRLEETEISAPMFSVLLGMLFINMMAFRSVEVFSERAEREAREIVLMKNYETTISQCRILEYVLASKSGLFHDLKFYAPTINQLADEGKVDKAIELIRAVLKSEAKQAKEYVQTSNNVVNAIFNFYIAYAQERGIKVDIEDVCFPKDLKMDIADLCTIFGNSLENAIEACAKVGDSEKYMVIRMYYIDEMLSYSIANPTDGNIIKGKNWFSSTKSTPGLKGLGIEAMNNAVRKYGGTFGAYHKNNEFKVKLAISNN